MKSHRLHFLVEFRAKGASMFVKVWKYPNTRKKKHLSFFFFELFSIQFCYAKKNI